MMLDHSPGATETIPSNESLPDVFMEPLLDPSTPSTFEPVEFNFEFSDHNYRYVTHLYLIVTCIYLC